MLYLDVAHNQVKEISGWIHEFIAKYGHEAAVSTHMNICIVEDCFWVALNSDNVLLQYNMQTDEYKFWNVGTRRIQYVTVSFDGDYFWLSGDQRFIVRWKKENNEVKEYDSFPDGFECGNKKISWKELFSCSHLWNGNLYFAPLNANMVISINRITGEIECVARIEENQICLKLIKLEDIGIYIEVDSCSGYYVKKSYLINSDNTCLEYPIEIKRHTEVDLSQGIKRGLCVIRTESHPYFILNFLMTVKSEESSEIFQESKGISIFKQTMKKV